MGIITLDKQEWEPLNTPFKPDDYRNLKNSIQKQASLGFGKLTHAAQEPETSLVRKAQCNAFVEMGFDHIAPLWNPPYYLEPGSFRIGREVVVTFESERGGRVTYGVNAFWPKCDGVNVIQAETWKVPVADYRKNPPEWAMIKADMKREHRDPAQLAIHVHESVKPKMIEKLLRVPGKRDLVLDIESSAGFQTPTSDIHQQVADQLLSMSKRPHEYVWRASLPLFPEFALELVARAQRTAPDATYFLIFKPEWTMERVELPKLDPIVVAYIETDEYHHDGYWFKIAQWGEVPDAYKHE